MFGLRTWSTKKAFGYRVARIPFNVLFRIKNALKKFKGSALEAHQFNKFFQNWYFKTCKLQLCCKI